MKTELVISSLNIFDYENTFASVKPKTFVYRDYKTFSHESFKNDSMSKTVDENVDFSKFEKEFIDTLNKQAPKKIKLFHGNKKPHVNTVQGSAIMKISRLKHKANKTREAADTSQSRFKSRLFGLHLLINLPAISCM